MYKSISSLAIFLFLISLPVVGQVSVEKSEKQTFILGKKYYLHEVKKGQTLYSICKAYNITERELIAENSNIVDGLKVGDELKIPADNANNAVTSNNKDKFIYHTVEKKQTLYFLSNKYNVSEAELIKFNPEITQGLRVGQIIKVPKPGSGYIETDTGYKQHTVQPGETLFSLSQKYGIDLATLKMENPELKDQGPRVGQTLRIPTVKKTFDEALIVSNENTNISSNPNVDPLYIDEDGIAPCGEFKYNSSMKFKVAVLLPLFVEENYAQKSYSSYYKGSGKFYEFYQGLLLASKKMKESGVSVEFYVKDTKDNGSKIQEILQDSELKNMDLMIGPVYGESFKIASDFAKENKINIVAPFKQKNENMVVSNPYIFLADPGNETEIGYLSKYLASSNDRNVVVVHGGTAEEIQIAELFKKKLVSANNSGGVVFKQINYRTAGASGLEDALSIGLDNIIIVPSKDVVFITNLSTKLNYLTKRYKITTFGMYPWDQLESVEMEYLQNLNFHYGTTNFIDHNDEKVKVFDYQYKTYFKDEPSIYSYLGYDVAYYFLNALKEYGKHFQFCISSQDTKPYKNGFRFDFNFERVSPFSGFENNWTRIVKIDENLQTVKVK